LKSLLLFSGWRWRLCSRAIAILVLRRLRSGDFLALLHEILSFFSILGRALLVLLLFVALVALMGPLGIVGWIILTFVLLEGSHKYRATRQYGLLWLLDGFDRTLDAVGAGHRGLCAGA